MNKISATQFQKAIAVVTALVMTMTGTAVSAQSLDSTLAERRAAVMRRLQPPSESALAAAKTSNAKIPGLDLFDRRQAGNARDVAACAGDSPNPLSSLVALEDNPAARTLDGFVLRDRRGRRTRPWRAHTRSERARRGAVTQRPLLVFLETPTERTDFNKPWFGPVRFDRPGFPTTKEKITEQIFGKNFDHRDPASVAGFYYRESGGKLIVRGDARSVHTVFVPHMTFDPAPMVEAILAQLDPIVDFTQHSDELGWVHPIFIMTPYSLVLDVYSPADMGNGLTYSGYGPTVYEKAPAITDDVFRDGSHAALSAVAINMIALGLGASQVSWHPWFGVPEDQTRNDRIELYAHEYGHTLGLGHMMTGDYIQLAQLHPLDVVGRVSPHAMSRDGGTGFATTIMNYSYGSGFGPNRVPLDSPPVAGLDPMNRSKLGWGNVSEVTLAEDDRSPGPRELAPGEQRRIEVVEHLGNGPSDPRPQILKVNLPPQRVSLFPRSDAAGNPTGYWRPGQESRRMVWSGRTYGGSRMMETDLRIPVGFDQPVLSFWTKYGAHGNLAPYPPGIDFGWVQISTDGGYSWTSLAGQTSSTFVDPYRQTFQFFGDDLGAPAVTGDSRWFGPNGWILEQVPLPIRPGVSFRLRFNSSGFGLKNTFPSQAFGWWIDEIYLGTRSNPTRLLVSDFEGEDARRWQGLLTEFDQGAGFVVVEDTSPFPQTYFFELRGNNHHDKIAFQEQYPKVLNSYLDDSIYTYDDGLVGYFANHYATFWAFPYLYTGSATNAQVPISRQQQVEICYPYCPGVSQLNYIDFGGAFAAASNPGSGVTLDDVVFLFTSPYELFLLAEYGQGVAYPVIGDFARPGPITLLDATPTYRPLEVAPALPETPFPERPPTLWPYIIGSPGGWPKTMEHGLLGFNDPTTTRALGQPFLGRDAAFHPARNAIFDDRTDYRGIFASEFENWHGPKTQAAFSALTPAERLKLLPAGSVPVSETEVIQFYRLQYCPQNSSGECGAPDQAIRRPFLEQVLYERFAYMVFLTNIGSCTAPPPEFTLETKPAWDAYHACIAAATETAHQRTNELLEVARNLGHNPLYSWLNSYGDQGTLSPGLWTQFYLNAWARAKGPEPLPSFGFSLEVERITPGETPKAILKLRRSEE